MRKILEEISAVAIQLNELTFTNEQINTNWLGNPPASVKEIKSAEERLGVEFPDDYKNFLLIANGFSRPINATEPTFENADKIDYLKTIDSFIIECYRDTSIDIERAIVIAGIEDEEYFLLIPPNTENPEWKYLKFASWLAGEQVYKDLSDYFISVLKFMKSMSK